MNEKYIKGIRVEDQDVINAYGFHICPGCQKRQGTRLGPSGSYSLYCEDCMEEMEEQFCKLHPEQNCIICGKKEHFPKGAIEPVCFDCRLKYNYRTIDFGLTYQKY